LLSDSMKARAQVHQEMRRQTGRHATHLHKRETTVDDPCSPMPDCQTCIESLNYCGWCSVKVLYNATTPGTQCAGLNQTKIPGFICQGTFSTVDCPNSNPPSAAPTTAPPTTIPPLRPTSPVKPPPPTVPPVLYVCNPNTSTCEKIILHLEECHLINVISHVM